jgi:hypothetical protein
MQEIRISLSRAVHPVVTAAALAALVLTYLGFDHMLLQTRAGMDPSLHSVSSSHRSTALRLTWQNINPGSVSLNPNSPANNYGTDTVVVDPQTPSTVYLGTCYQGLWKSTDSGSTWFKVNTGTNGSLLDSGRIWALAIDPVNPQILYTTAGYGNGGILKSTDGGKDWTDVFSGTPQAQQLGTNDIYSIAIDPTNDQHLVAAFHYYWYGNQDSGVVESTNGGSTWTIHAPGGSWGAGNAVWFVNNSSTWLVGSQSAGIWRTTNSGGTWTQVYSQNISHGGINAFYRNPATGTLYLALWTQVVKSTDSGASWQDITSGLPYAAYESIIGDGSQVFTAPSFPDLGTNSQTTGWYVLSEQGGASWQQEGTQAPCTGGTCNGPAMMAYDAIHHIVYGANWDAGTWQLSESGATSRVLMRAHGTGTRFTRILTFPSPWRIEWSFQGGSSRARPGIRIVVYSGQEQRAKLPLIQQSVRSGHGNHIYEGAGRFYLKIACAGSWHVSVRA